MSTGETAGPVHPVPTRRSGYRYLFYAIHHGRGGPDDAQWLPTMSHDEEFGVFDMADFHDLSDEGGRLYGVRRGPLGEILALGTWGQQVAEFPFARENETWHGYPLWPLKDAGPPNRRGENRRPSKVVFQKLEDERLITRRGRKRLWKGNYA